MTNGDIRSDLGEFVSSQSAEYIVGGGFNFGRDILEGMGFAKSSGGQLITTSDNASQGTLP
eukprot:7305256-Pyramimonas_sp.AAC.1